jgi:hypothetical protein
VDLADAIGKNAMSRSQRVVVALCIRPSLWRGPDPVQPDRERRRETRLERPWAAARTMVR